MRCYVCGNTISDEKNGICPVCGAANEISEDLVARAVAGDDGAFSELYAKTVNEVKVTTKSLIKSIDDVDDIVQNVYVKALTHPPVMKDSKSYKAWLKQVAHNEAIDFLRKKRALTFTELEREDEEDDKQMDPEDENHIYWNPEKTMDQKEASKILFELLDTLPEEQRLSLVMFYFNDMSIKQIAEQFGTNENTIKSRMSAAKKKLAPKIRELEKKGVKLYGYSGVSLLMFLYKNATVETEKGSEPLAGKISAARASEAVNKAAETGKNGIMIKIMTGIIGVLIAGGIVVTTIFSNRQIIQDKRSSVESSIDVFERLTTEGTSDEPEINMDTEDAPDRVTVIEIRETEAEASEHLYQPDRNKDRRPTIRDIDESDGTSSEDDLSDRDRDDDEDDDRDRDDDDRDRDHDDRDRDEDDDRDRDDEDDDRDDDSEDDSDESSMTSSESGSESSSHVPSTEVPTSYEPSSMEPWTEEPTSQVPTEPSSTEVPTEEPSTPETSEVESESEAPSSEEPTSGNPSTEPSGPESTEASSREPSSPAPTDPPSSREPSSQAPTDPPSSREPSSQAPTTPPSSREPSSPEPTTPPSSREPSSQEPTTPPSSREPSSQEPTTPPSSREPSTPAPTEPSSEPTTPAPTTPAPTESSADDDAGAIMMGYDGVNFNFAETPGGLYAVTVTNSGNNAMNFSFNDMVGDYWYVDDGPIQNAIGSIDFAANITSIGNNAFTGCSRLQTVNIPGVTFIGDNAFAGCAIGAIRLPHGIQHIGSNALSSVSYIEYDGTQAEWEAVSLGANAYPAGCTIVFLR